jgi:hypothetical protein
MIFRKELEKLRKQNILELNLKILRYFGTLLDDSVNKTRLERVTGVAKQLFTMFLVVQYFLGTSVQLYLSLNDIHKTGDCFIFFISHLKNVVKFGTLIINRKKILRLLTKIENNYYIHGITTTDAQRSLVRSYMNLSKRIAKWVWITYIVTLVPLIINQPPRPNLQLITDPEEINDVRRDSSMKMWFPFRAIESPYFELTLVYENITMSIYLVFVTTVNVTLVGLIIHMTAQFAVLVEAIQNGVTRAVGLPAEKRRKTGMRAPSLITRLAV